MPHQRDRQLSSEVSVAEVARRARVSVGTVSRVINQHPQVDPILRRRVQIASRQLGFVPRKQHHCIALVTGRKNPALRSMGYTSMMTSMLSQYLAEAQYAVELIDVENLETLYEARVQGVIGVVFDDRLVEALKIPNLPVVTVNRPLTRYAIHSIRADHYQQGRLAAEHMIARGHRAIGILLVRTDVWGSMERIRGYRDAMSAAGLPVDPTWIQNTLGAKIYDILGRWTGTAGITGILSFSEDAGLEVQHILSNTLKLRVGQDISVISLGDLPIYEYLTPPHTTVSQPLEAMAHLAVDTMTKLCGGDVEPGQVVDICLPTELIIRDSVAIIGPPAAATINQHPGESANQ